MSTPSTASPFASLKEHWKSDPGAGFVVFLIALPLSLGIAMASGVPPLAGLIAAIVGGIIVSRISGSHVVINGPAAGLIVVVLHGVEVLGQGNPQAGYRGMLAVTVLAGLAMAVAGRFKAGKLGDLFPSSVVHGMLAAIGVIIFAKQVHTALGVSPESKSPLSLLVEIPKSVTQLNPEIALIALVSLVLLIGLPLLPWTWAKRIPAPMAVVLVGLALGRFFDLEHQHSYLFLEGHQYTVGPKFLVSLPEQVLSGIALPDWSAVGRQGFWAVFISLFLVQGLETLLSAAAVDRFDPSKRVADLNKDLTGVGIGTAVSGFLGGLPIIAEIVRSRANVSNGARTGWSNFFHGVFLLAFVVLVPGLIHQIPLACLAAILIVTGYRLASPAQFKHTLHIGMDQFALFSVTLIATLATDLVVGVCTGIALKVVLHLVRGTPLSSFFSADAQVKHEGNDVRVTFKKGAVFANYLSVKKTLHSLPKKARIILDMSDVSLLDHTVMEKLQLFVEDYIREGGVAEIQGLERLRASSAHPLASRVRGRA